MKAVQKVLMVTEFTACAECDSDELIATRSAGDESLNACEACGTVEGETRTLWLNEETGEVTADMSVADAWDKKCEECGKAHETVSNVYLAGGSEYADPIALCDGCKEK